MGDSHIQNGGGDGCAQNVNNGSVAVKVEVEADDADVKSVNTSSSSAARAMSGVAKQPRLFDRSLSVGAKSKSRLQFVSPAKRSRLESQAQQQVPAESDSDDNDMHDQSYDSDAFSDGAADAVMTSPQPTKAAKKLSGSVTSAKIKSPRRKSEGSKPRSQSVSAVAAKKQERRKPSAMTCESFFRCCLCCGLLYTCCLTV